MTTELRRFLRTATEYRVEYGLFPHAGDADSFRTSTIRNIGAGGLLFEAEEDQPIGRQLVLKIHMTGWRLAGEDIVEAGSDSEALITAIAEVRRCDYNPATHRYAVGVQFLGRVLS